jgi:hypothetical protein
VCGLATDEQTDLSLGANWVVIVTNVAKREEKFTRMFKNYNEREEQTRERQARKINSHKIFQ